MIDNTMYGFLSSKIEEMRQAGESYWSIGSKANLSQTTIENIHKKLLKGRPTIETACKLLHAIGYNNHEIAHIAFNLPPPADLGELDEPLRELCDLAMRLSGEEREQLTEKIRAYLEARESLFGMELGGDANRAQHTRPAKKAGHG